MRVTDRPSRSDPEIQDARYMPGYRPSEAKIGANKNSLQNLRRSFEKYEKFTVRACSDALPFWKLYTDF